MRLNNIFFDFFTYHLAIICCFMTLNIKEVSAASLFKETEKQFTAFVDGEVVDGDVVLGNRTISLVPDRTSVPCQTSKNDIKECWDLSIKITEIPGGLKRSDELEIIVKARHIINPHHQPEKTKGKPLKFTLNTALNGVDVPNSEILGSDGPEDHLSIPNHKDHVIGLLTLDLLRKPETDKKIYAISSYDVTVSGMHCNQCPIPLDPRDGGTPLKKVPEPPLSFALLGLSFAMVIARRFK